MQLEQLEKIGLKEKEAKVYIALLKEGQSLANHIAKKTTILRSSIYDYFDILLDKGFISYTIKSGKKYFQATHPQKIIENFEEKKRKEEIALKKIIPNLTKLQNLTKKKANVEVFEGKDGLKSVMSKILKENPKEILAFGSSGASYKIIPFFIKHWHDERARKNIKIRIIYNDAKETRERLKKGPKIKLKQLRLLPVNVRSITGTLIYKNKTILTIWSPETPLAISIESKDVTKNYKDNFEILWKMSKEINK